MQTMLTVTDSLPKKLTPSGQQCQRHPAFGKIVRQTTLLLAVRQTLAAPDSMRQQSARRLRCCLPVIAPMPQNNSASDRQCLQQTVPAGCCRRTVTKMQKPPQTIGSARPAASRRLPICWMQTEPVDSVLLQRTRNSPARTHWLRFALLWRRKRTERSCHGLRQPTAL